MSCDHDLPANVAHLMQALEGRGYEICLQNRETKQNNDHVAGQWFEIRRGDELVTFLGPLINATSTGTIHGVWAVMVPQLRAIFPFLNP